MRQIHKEKMEGGKVKIEMKSRFGHAYITKIDEGEKWGKGGQHGRRIKSILIYQNISDEVS